MLLSNRTKLLGTSAFAVAAMSISGAAFAQSASAVGTSDAENAESAEIVVTGVFGAKAAEDAPISISVVTSEELNQQVANSAADLIRNVPGVFVNSSLGEIRNVVFSRGVSANSLDGAGGYYYVSLQEDGLPVEPATNDNFGPDYYSRPDIMLSRLEGLRGGTATVTGTNAPGGIFNYISRTGKSDPGVEVQAKFGLEGDGRNPYYRADLYAGGKAGENLYYAIGGFYRKSDGARNPGYALNKGGQVRANLLYDYGSGSLKFDAKYLNDHNGFFEFTPAVNYSDPKIAPGFNKYSSILPPRAPHSFTNPDGSTGSWDGSDLVHSRSLSFGLTWDHDLADNITIQNRARYSKNKSDWSTGALIFPLTLDDFFTNILIGTFGTAGVIDYRDQATGNLLARVNSFSGFDHTVTTNNLPNQSTLQNGVFSQLAFSQRFRSETFQDQLTLGAELGAHKLAVGAYFSHTKLFQRSGSAGFGISTFASKPQLLDVTLTRASDGAVLRLTDPAGFSQQGGGIADGDGYSGKQRQISLFAGDEWQINEQLSLDAGLRYESIRYNINNLTLAGAVPVNGGAGADGNPLTLWDNTRQTYGAATNTKRSYSFVNYTAALNYKVNDNFQTYIRYTRGKKAPDFGITQRIDTPSEIATQFYKAQTITQVELGLKYNNGPVRIGVFPFYSKLANVGDSQTFTLNTAGQISFYSPPAVFGQIETYGVEIDADADISSMLNLRTAITLQNPKASKFGAYTPGLDTTTADDTLVLTPKGDADNNPKLLTRTTATLTPTESVSLFLTHNYTGKRAANRNNAWYMPGFHTFDFGASVTFGAEQRFKIQANVNNLFNQTGILSWARAGGFFNSLDRQGLTKAGIAANPNQLLSVISTQPRSFWLTGTMKF